MTFADEFVRCAGRGAGAELLLRPGFDWNGSQAATAAAAVPPRCAGTSVAVAPKGSLWDLVRLSLWH